MALDRLTAAVPVNPYTQIRVTFKLNLYRFKSLIYGDFVICYSTATFETKFQNTSTER